MRREDMADLTLFLAVVDEGGFTRAAKRLGTSQSALSHSVQRLEERLGLRLLNRTTRSVAPTDAGERLVEILRPAIRQIDVQLAALKELGGKPAGTVRMTASEHAAQSILWPAIDKLTTDYPDIHIEVDVDTRLTDIVAERFDAGVRLGERLEKDMIAVRIGPQLRMAAVASPAYFSRRGMPEAPRDLAQHACINVRLATGGGLYVWEFSKAGRELKVKVEGHLTFNRVSLVLDAVHSGHGIAFLLEDHVERFVADGSLIRVLEDWCEPFDGYHLYYPQRRQPSPAFSLLLEALRYRA